MSAPRSCLGVSHVMVNRCSCGLTAETKPFPGPHRCAMSTSAVAADIEAVSDGLDALPQPAVCCPVATPAFGKGPPVPLCLLKECGVATPCNPLLLLTGNTHRPWAWPSEPFVLLSPSFPPVPACPSSLLSPVQSWLTPLPALLAQVPHLFFSSPGAQARRNKLTSYLLSNK